MLVFLKSWAHSEGVVCSVLKSGGSLKDRIFLSSFFFFQVTIKFRFIILGTQYKNLGILTDIRKILSFSADDLRTFGLCWFHWIGINSDHLIAAWSLTESNLHLSESPEYTTDVPLL